MALKTEIQNRAPSALRAMELVFADPTLKKLDLAARNAGTRVSRR
eukprot:CAMPEP_0175660668 /NCGR_PEP_ID=MMETSP0097-20121207/14562_1 /TAXON_ID=311494 /ORGANISM="Alexandrium monilatum, Strain CCMP3105" /LENGTH=44 /DNA_ID= /DNA_START= /DNA_END= /DNA_ORIENTATION=